MLLSQATDSCPGSRFQVWSPQLWPEPGVAWRCRPSMGQHGPCARGGRMEGRVVPAMPGPRGALREGGSRQEPRLTPVIDICLDTLHPGLGGTQGASVQPSTSREPSPLTQARKPGAASSPGAPQTSRLFGQGSLFFSAPPNTCPL